MAAKKKVVLLLTHRHDWGPVEWVSEALLERDALPRRIDSDRFPSEQLLSTHLGGAKRESLRLDGVHFEDVRAVWWRRLWPAQDLTEVAQAHQDAAYRMSREAYLQTLGLLDCTWVNPLQPGLRAEEKLLQLREASKVGLRVPETLITNDAAAVRTFAKRHRRIITKLLAPLIESMNGDPGFFYTQLVTPAHLRALDGLRHAPQIFQPLIEKQRELRVVVVGKEVFVGSLDARGVGKGALDWRQLTVEDGVQWQPDALSAGLKKKVVRLTAELGLSFAALDFIVPKSGEPFFLELNPAGEWGFLEAELSFPISRALAKLLLS